MVPSTRENVPLVIALVMALFAVPGCGDGGANLPSALRYGELAISIVTTGQAVDLDGYLLSIDGGAPSRVPAHSDTLVQLVAGKHDISLDDLAPPCQVVGGPWTRFIASGHRNDLTIQVSCLAPGSLTITSATEGPDPDADGYQIVIDGTSAGGIGVDGELQIPAVSAGGHLVELRGVAGNCEVLPDRSRSVQVAELTAVEIDYTINCSPRPVYPAGEYLVVAGRSPQDQDTDLYLLSADGTLLERLTDDPASEALPRFSPDGSRIAFLRPEPGVAEHRLMMLELTTRQETALPLWTSTAAGWSPDATRIVFNREGALYLADADGGALSVLTQTQSAGEGHWSPDGTSIAFTRGSLSLSNVYVITPDGTGLRPLTSQGWRTAGPWSPMHSELVIQVAGAEICSVFGWPSQVCYRPSDLALLSAATMEEQLISTLWDEIDPSWSPAGDALLFIAWDGGQADVYRMPRDGGQTVNVTRSSLVEVSFSIGRIR